MLRILQILPKLEMGGVERSTIQTAIALKYNNMVPVVISNGGKMVELLDKEHITHINLWVNSKNPIIILLNGIILTIIIITKKINIVHARSRAPAWSAWLACKITGTKFITTFHGFYSGYDGFIKNKYNSVMTFGKKTIVSTKFMEEHLIKYYKVNKNNITLIPRGINLEQFKNISQIRKNILINKYNIKNNENIITLPGRLTAWKGQYIFLEAIKILKNKPNIKYLIVGKGHKSFQSNLEKFIDTNKLNVIIDTDCSDIPALYQISDIILSTSIDNETFGRVAVEGQASGKIVIATNIGGSNETIIDNKTGILIEPNNPIILAETINRILDKKIILKKEKIIENSIKFNNEEFSRNIISLYKQL